MRSLRSGRGGRNESCGDATIRSWGADMKTDWWIVCAMGILGCGTSVPVDYPTDAAAVITKALSNDVKLSGEVKDAGYHVYDLGSVPASSELSWFMCGIRKTELTETCRTLRGDAEGPPGCTVTAAQIGDWVTTPVRCAMRFTFPAHNESSIAKVLTLDLDPCTSFKDCQSLPFNGCETVIQRQFEAAQIARVDAATWSSPRTHVMMHGPVSALRPVDAALCNEARVAADNVCGELVATMSSFISTCRPTVVFAHDDHEDRDFCAVRFEVGFSHENPSNAVVTTELDGLLSFSLR